MIVSIISIIAIIFALFVFLAICYCIIESIFKKKQMILSILLEFIISICILLFCNATIICSLIVILDIVGFILLLLDKISNKKNKKEEQIEQVENIDTNEEIKEDKEIFGVIYKITNTKNRKVYIGQTTNKKGYNGRYPHKGVGIERIHAYHYSRKKTW